MSRYPRRKKPTSYHSWGDQIATSRKYVATLTPAERVRAVENMILSSTRREQTDAHLCALAQQSGYDTGTYESAVNNLLDAGHITATVIGDIGGGFHAGLVRTAKSLHGRYVG